MREPLVKGGYTNHGKSGTGFVANLAGNNLGSRMTSAKRKADYCWNFNKGLKCKFGKKM